MDRRQVLAYRIAEHGLHRTARDLADLAVVRAGLQDSMRDTALLALVARLDGEVSLVDDPRLVLAWTLRGAPHFHLGLAEVTRALVPLDDADALARMLWQRKELAATGQAAADVVFTAAAALRKVVTKPMTKGAASTAVTKALPPSFSRWCRGCGATHIQEQLMRIAAPHAGVRLVAGASPATLAPLEGRGRMRRTPDPAAATKVVEDYLRLNGPATPGEAAEFVGTAKAVVDRTWPADLAEVEVEGRRKYLPAAQLPALENPPEPDLVRLLPPLDPFIQARDKTLLVPDPARRKEVWKMLGNPGVLLADGDIAGTWRTKGSGAKLTFTVTAFDPLRPPLREEAEAEAARVAAARGFEKHAVSWVG
ncbi:crosslink repair DNA glycosylase YcaQ family protein [Amycolatopsis sp. SID8362]|uniref:DNA glycosylase AlkZ-like family protein n=1 Tax=Amycolatopsis sp. SID8362 TaxID=2690346 RepID=UPI0013686D15|nr:crosslink repair DNA glycosylase YcaQ family protein [Amycolatopsis sp. SID8362]NBH10207.1 winged helix DNA-binding domain-containing protein [Amycolatopsis sp. SID8362]NED46902.1 winged helix DNA-binding domain-containing protein [Amycolatopsis sp. SID8362]